MPIAVQFDQPVGGRLQRAQMYEGAINVTSPSEASIAYVTFARQLIGEAFGGRDPELAQFDLPVAEYAAILGSLKRRFAAHPESKRLLQQVLLERGCDPEATYFDVPRLRVSTSDDYLGTGVAYAWHPHRDTWCSAPLAQLDHWMPVYEISEDNALAIHTEYFNQAVANGSAAYNHYQWNAKRRAAAESNVRAESHALPGPTEPIEGFSSSVFVMPVGGMLEFSGHHLHSDVPNDSGRTRFSIDFHTVDVADVRAGLGARNVDGQSTGSTIRDFTSAADLSALPQDVVALFDDGTETAGDLVYVPPTQPAPTVN